MQKWLLITIEIRNDLLVSSIFTVNDHFNNVPKCSSPMRQTSQPVNRAIAHEMTRGRQRGEEK